MNKKQLINRACKLNFREKLLRAAFEMIQNPDDWMSPINTVIWEEDFDLCREACGHFLSSGLNNNGRVHWEGDAVEVEPERFLIHVTAKGYCHGHAGP